MAPARLVGRLDLAYTTIGERGLAACNAGSRACWPGARPTRRRPRPCGRDLPTAVAQAEVEDREIPGVAVRGAVPAGGAGAGGVREPQGVPRWIGRGPGTLGGAPVDRDPRGRDDLGRELLAACAALVAHPDDARHRDLVGTTATTPLFGVPVPVLAHRLADPGKGTGLAMICTFGDLTDVLWWRELRLPVRSIVGRDGRIQAQPPDGVPAAGAWAELAGRTTAEARRRVVELLGPQATWSASPVRSPTRSSSTRTASGRWRSGTSRQWFIRPRPPRPAAGAGQELNGSRRSCAPASTG